ncbi:innexin [Plakobranchus ocellatus]|uniref:Innexin n=1 Tax=Plakobranchus ocellatus TaxID=259542 RepID=A0AAV4A4E7_9GAST|nr:innexin [Plakobranchus ocellatus]
MVFFFNFSTGRGYYIRNRLDALWKRSGYFLVVLYLLVKISSMFLSVNFWTFGPRALGYTLFSHTTERRSGAGWWLHEEVFPRIALCDFRLRQLNNVQVHTVQCVLSINIFLEKMYLMLWFFLVLMTIMNLYSLIKWSIDLLSARKTRHFLDKFAHVITPGKTPKNSEIRHFNSLARSYLKSDGIFLVKMIAANTTDILAADLLRQIWVRYKKYSKNKDRAPVELNGTEDKDGDNYLDKIVPH